MLLSIYHAYTVGEFPPAMFNHLALEGGEKEAWLSEIRNKGGKQVHFCKKYTTWLFLHPIHIDLRQEGIEPPPQPWKGWILTTRPLTLGLLLWTCVMSLWIPDGACNSTCDLPPFYLFCTSSTPFPTRLVFRDQGNYVKLGYTCASSGNLC